MKIRKVESLRTITEEEWALLSNFLFSSELKEHEKRIRFFCINCLLNFISINKQKIRSEKLKEYIFQNKDRIIGYRKKLKEKPYYYLISRVKSFQKKGKCTIPFTYLDVLERFGENPVCYLTGIPLNLNDPKGFSLDHIIPLSKGGLSNLDNLQLTLLHLNIMKYDLSVDDFIKYCGIVFEYSLINKYKTYLDQNPKKEIYLA